MHGLINRSLQYFVCDTAGKAVWKSVVQRADLEFESFEAMLDYEPEVTFRVIDAASICLGKAKEELLEDLGIYLVSYPSLKSLRRLLRFSGVNYEDFLLSLNDLSDRARLAVSDLDLPNLNLKELGNGEFKLYCHSPYPEFGNVLVGVLRAMADDYGTLALLELEAQSRKLSEISISLIQASYAEGKRFDLAVPQ